MELSSQPSLCLDPELHRLHQVKAVGGEDMLMPTPGANPGAAPAWCVAALLQSAGFTQLGEQLGAARSEEPQGAPAILGINLPSAIFTSSGERQGRAGAAWLLVVLPVAALDGGKAGCRLGLWEGQDLRSSCLQVLLPVEGRLAHVCPRPRVVRVAG